MSALVLYLAVAAIVIWLWRRFVQPVSLAAAIVLVLLPLCFTGRALLTGKIYAPVDLPFMSEPLRDYAKDYGTDVVHNGNLSDLYMQIIPWRQAVRYAIARAEWPLWNPFILCGDILAQSAQPAPYDPFNLASLLIPMAPSLTFTAAITFFLAGFFTFAFARALGTSELAALIAAPGFMFCGVFAFFVAWPLARAWAFLPLVLIGVRMVVREPGARSTMLLTIAFVLLIFAGHPESVLHVTFVGALYGLFELQQPLTRLLRSRPLPLAGEGRREASGEGLLRVLSRPILHAILAGILALLLTAIFLLPFADATDETVERKFRTEQFANSDFPILPELIARRAGVAFFPWFGGGPENDNFTPLWDPLATRVGGLTLALALAALLLARRRRETWFFLALALFCLCAALDAPPVAHLLHELPIFDMALNERLAFAAAFALSILAALAVDAWGDRRAAIILLAVLAILAVATWQLSAWQLGVGVRAELIRKLALFDLLPIAAAALLLATRTRLHIAAPILLGLILIQRTAEDGSLYPTLPHDVFYPPVPVLEAIPKDGQHSFRTVGMHFALIPGTSTFYGLEDVRGYQAMTYQRIAQTYPLWAIPQPISFNAVADLRSPILSMLNVRYAISPGDANAPEGWKLLVTDRDTSLLENTRALPRAFVPRRIKYEQLDKNVLEAMKTATDYAELSWITAPEVGPHEIANGPGTLKILRRDGLGHDIQANMEGDGWVVISNSAWKGWRAYIDGKRIQPHYANHAFLGVYVPQGIHHLQLVYLPESFTRGRNISFATLAALIAWGWWRRRARRRTPPTPA